MFFTVYITIVSQTTESFTNPPKKPLLVYKNEKIQLLPSLEQLNEIIPPYDDNIIFFYKKRPQFCSLTLKTLSPQILTSFYFFSHGIGKAVVITAR